MQTRVRLTFEIRLVLLDLLKTLPRAAENKHHFIVRLLDGAAGVLLSRLIQFRCQVPALLLQIEVLDSAS